jgi:hypothetical protein
MRPADLDTRSRDLFDRGFRDLESRFNPEVALVRNAFQPDKHQPHPSIWYAHCLLVRNLDDDAALAQKIINAALDLQERRPDDPHYGNFRWFLEDPVVTDLNACQFAVEALVHLLLRVSDRLTEETKRHIADSMRLALCEANRLDVHWTYTNIYLLDVHNSILGGRLLGDDVVRGRGECRLREWAERTKEAGAPHEFNSPTYSAVQINALAAIAQFAEDPAIESLALEMEQFVWRHVARYWHAPTMQLSGPHSRAYRRDVTGAPGFLKVVLHKLLQDPRLLAGTPHYSGPDTEGEVQVAVTEYHCPRDAESMFQQAGSRGAHEQIGPAMILNACIRSEFALGTMSRPYNVGDPAEPWPMHDSCLLYYSKPSPPGYGVLYCRYRINARPVGEASREAAPPWMDIWDDGVFRTAQLDGRALAAYGLSPRGQRPIDSLRLDIRLIGATGSGDIVVAGRPFQGKVIELEPPESIVLADGDVYVGIVPLEATRLGEGPTAVAWTDGQELVVSIINYEGPPKVFWDYRSLAGPFFKGNVKNGFALWAAPRAEFQSLQEFAHALDTQPPGDETSGSMRRIEWLAGDEQITLEYDLKEMRS